MTDPRLQRAAPYLAAAAVAVIALLLVSQWLGSASTASTPSPSPSASVPASVAPSASPSASASPSVAPSTSPSASPSPTSTPSPTPTASPTPTPASACEVKPETGQLPTDRVVSVEVSTSPTADFVTFVFDTGSLSPGGPPEGELTAAEPPFTFASSGLPLKLAGQHALQVRMSGMSLYNDVGEPTYTGERDIKVSYPALKQVVMYDESEGYAGWYIGYSGTGCVDLVRDGGDVVVTIAHP